MADTTEGLVLKEIDLIQDGQSAYGFRESVNKAIGGVNSAFLAINKEYEDIVDTKEKILEAENSVIKEINDNKDAIVKDAKDEMNAYAQTLIANMDKDIAKVRISSSEPISTGADGEDNRPNFWYKVIK